MATRFSKTEKRIMQIDQKLTGYKRLARCAMFPLRVLDKLEKLGFDGTVRFTAQKLENGAAREAIKRFSINRGGGTLPICKKGVDCFDSSNEAL